MQNLLSPQNIAQGLCETIYIAPLDWFTTGGVKKVDEGTVTIIENHQFTSGVLGFVQCYLAPQKNKLSVKTIGDLQGNHFEYELEVYLPGGYIENHSQTKQWFNKPLIVLVTDVANSSIVYQIGTEFKPAYLTADFSTGKDKEGSKGYLVKVQTVGCMVQLYQGNIKIYEQPYNNNATPIFYSLQKIVNNNLQNMIDAYQSAFTFSISQILALLQAKTNNYVIQLEYRDEDNVSVSVKTNDIDSSSLLNFITSVINILNNANNGNYTGNFYLTLVGSKLLVKNVNITNSNQYLGFSLVQAGLMTEEGDSIITEEGDILIPEEQ